MLREIGGYLELERFEGSERYPDALALSCARACLAYLIEARGISTLWVPWFLCGSVEATCERYGVEVRKYQVREGFLPDLSPDAVGKGEYLYLVDYYGQLSDDVIAGFAEGVSGRIVVDEVMAFFHRPIPGLDTIYSCRKFFGVADGGYLFTDARLGRELERDESHDRMGFVLGRFERAASEFYAESSANNSRFATEDIKLMSPLTHNILRAVDYERVREVRERNFSLLHERLGGRNELSPSLPTGSFMYPLLIQGGAEVRGRLQRQGLYIPTLWGYATDAPGLSGRYARDILPLPVDQRYDADDMAYVCELVEREMVR